MKTKHAVFEVRRGITILAKLLNAGEIPVTGRIYSPRNPELQPPYLESVTSLHVGDLLVNHEDMRPVLEFLSGEPTWTFEVRNVKED